MNHSPDLDQLAPALVKAQAEMGPALKDAENPFFRSKYADLPSVMRAASEPLRNNGLAITQMSRVVEPYYHEQTNDQGKSNTVMVLGVIVETILMHESGQWIGGECYLPLAKHDPQAIGIGITYGRRYGAAAILGMVQDDDDGNGASYPPANYTPPTNYNQSRPQTPPPTQTPPPATAPVAPAVDYIGNGEAKKKETKLKELCTALNKAGSKSNGNVWNSESLNQYCMDGFDTPLAQISKEELEVLLVDLDGILQERLAMQPDPAPTTPTHTGNTEAMATENQISACSKMAKIRGADETEVALAVSGGEWKLFAHLTGVQAGEAIKYMTKMAKK